MSILASNACRVDFEKPLYLITSLSYICSCRQPPPCGGGASSLSLSLSLSVSFCLPLSERDRAERSRPEHSCANGPTRARAGPGSHSAVLHATLPPSPICIWGLDVIRKEAWSFYRTISGVRLCWELEEPKGPKGHGGRPGGCPGGGETATSNQK